MAPVPAKTLRLSELDESDRTAYFSVTALMERGKAVAARTQPPPPIAEPARLASEPPLAAPVTTSAPPQAKPSILEQLRDASMARKATLVIMPLLIGFIAMNPVFEAEMTGGASPQPSASHAPALPQHVGESDAQTRLAPTPAEPPPVLPKGVTLERAAADAIAGGDFQRALGFYRELSRRSPENASYREAARILERRALALGKQP
ncbi:MAG: hypothetical protein K0R38_2382 [Polyangiaceae bacterium]|jgi:hypothetical protein|nr:hypothetical protein [Polyangiaceae bacterium]